MKLKHVVGAGLAWAMISGLEAAPAEAVGAGLRRDVFRNLPGAYVSHLLESEPFPHRPSATQVVAAFESSRNDGEFYGQILYGWLTPPVSGRYRFYVASDDTAALYLSGDASAANLRRIALEPQWADWRQYTSTERRPNRENVSAYQTLEAGRSYFVLGLSKEQGAGDGFSVAWDREGQPPVRAGDAPVPGAVLSAPPAEYLRTGPPAILIGPELRPYQEGDTLVLSVFAAGAGPLQYQWLHNGAPIPGAAARVLKVPGIRAEHAGAFAVRVSNGLGEATSASVQVRPRGVGPATGPVVNPGNGNRYYLLEASSWPAAQHAARRLGGHLATIRNASEQGFLARTFSTWGGFERDLWIGMHQPVWEITTERPPVAEVARRMIWASGESATYRNWLSGEPNLWDGAEFFVSLRPPCCGAGGWNDWAEFTQWPVGTTDHRVYAYGVVEVLSAPPPVATVARQPGSVAVAAGGSVSLVVEATGEGRLSYQWERDGWPIQGATTARLDLPVVGEDRVGDYLVRITNPGGTVVSQIARVTLATVSSNPPLITGQPQARTVTEGESVTLTVVATGTSPLTYQWFRDGIPVDGANAATLILNAVQLSQGGAYTVQVSNEAGFDKSAPAQIEVRPRPVAPTITAGPVGGLVNPGQTFLFRVTATGTAPLSYQWWKDGQPIAGATEPHLVVSGIRVSDAGSYSVVVSNAAGTVTSAPATLEVFIPSSSRQPPGIVWNLLQIPPSEIRDSLQLDPLLLARDAGGATFVAASFVGSLTSFGPDTPSPLNSTLPPAAPRLFVSKIGPDGQPRWRRVLDAPLGREWLAQALTTDRLGNVYVAGAIEHRRTVQGHLVAQISENARLFVAKFSPEGDQLWASETPSGFGATRLFVDALGNVTTWSQDDLTGFAWPLTPGGTVPTDANLYPVGGMAHFKRDGALAWTRKFGAGQEPVIATVREAGDGRLILSGWKGDVCQRFILDPRSNQWDPAPQWRSTSVGGPRFRSVAEWAGGVYVLSRENDQLHLACFTDAPTPVWKVQVPVPGDHRKLVPSLEVDAWGNAFLGIGYQLLEAQASSQHSLFVAAYRPDEAGRPGWTWQHPEVAPGTPGFRDVRDVRLRLYPDQQGGLAVVASLVYEAFTSRNLESQLIRLSSTGRLLWTELAGRTALQRSPNQIHQGHPVLLLPDQSVVQARVPAGSYLPGGHAYEVVVRKPAPQRFPLHLGVSEPSPWHFGYLEPGRAFNPFSSSAGFWATPNDTDMRLLYVDYPLRVISDEPLDVGGAGEILLQPGEVLVSHQHERLEPGQTLSADVGPAVRWAPPGCGTYAVRLQFDFGTQLNGLEWLWPDQPLIRVAIVSRSDPSQPGRVLTEIRPAKSGLLMAERAVFHFEERLCPEEILEISFHDQTGAGRTRPNVLLRADLHRVVEPPSVAVRLGDGGSAVLPGSQPVIQAMSQGFPAIAEAVDFFLDGRWVGRAAGNLAEVKLPPLAAGVATVHARAATGELFSRSSPLRLYVGDSPEVQMDAAELQQKLFVAYATEAYLQGESTWEGAVESVLLDAVAAIRRADPTLPGEWYAGLIDRVRERAASRAPVGPGRLAGRRLHSPGPSDPDDVLQTTLKDAVEIVADVVSQIPVVGTPLVNAIKRDWEKVARRCAEPGAEGVNCNIARFYGVKSKSIEELVVEFKEETITNHQLLTGRLSAGIWRKIDMQSGDLIKAFREELAPANSKLDRTLEGMDALLNGQGDLQAGLGALRTDLEDFFAEVHEGIREQLARSDRILETQHDILGILVDQERQKRAAEQLRAEAELQQAQEELRLQGIRSSLFLLGTFIGQTDPKLAREVTALGESALGLHAAIKAFNSQREVSGWASAILAANVVGIGLNLVQSFQDTGPTAEELILEQLGVIRDMIAQLGDQMHERFDRVDQALNQIYSDFTARFDSIDFRLGLMQVQLRDIESSLVKLNDKVDNILRTQYLLAKDEELGELRTTYRQLLNYRNDNTALDLATFNRIGAELFSFAEEKARGERFAPLAGLSPNDASISNSLAQAGGPYGALNYLAAVAADPGRRWATGTLRPGTRLPSLLAWQEGVMGYFDLIEWNPELARRESVRSNLRTLRQTHDTLRQALADLTLTRSGNQVSANRLLWQQLLANYRDKAGVFTRALSDYQRTVRQDALDPHPNDPQRRDPHRRNAAAQLDLWGPLHQTAGYVPGLLRQGPDDRHMTYGNPPGTLDGGPLHVPDGLADYLRRPELGVLIAADLLGQATLKATYGGTELVEKTETDRRSRWVQDLNILGNSDWFEFQTSVRFHSRFRAIALLHVSMGSSVLTPDVKALQLRYIHPELHFYSIQYLNWRRHGWWPLPPSPDLLNLLAEASYEPMPQPFSFWSPPASDLSGVRQLWPSPAELVRTYWYGGWEPDMDGRREVPSAKAMFMERAVKESLLDTSVNWPGRGSVIPRRVLEDGVEAKLRGLQRNFYQATRDALASQQPALAPAATALNGAHALLVSFVQLGLPESFEFDDAVRSLLIGAEPLPDATELMRLCGRGEQLSRSSLDHRERIDFAAIFERRAAALEAALMRRLDEIERTQRPEVLPLLSSTLARLDEVTELVTAAPPPPPPPPPQPPTLSLTLAPDGVRVIVSGQAGVRYRVEYSPDLRNWGALDPTVVHGQPLDVQVAGQSVLYFRARTVE